MAYAHSKRSTKFEPRVTKRLTCSLEKVSRCANYVHVPCKYNVHPRSAFYSAVMPFSYCTGVPSLVSLGQNFTNPEDPTLKKFSPSGTCRLCCLAPVATMARAHPLELSAQED